MLKSLIVILVIPVSLNSCSSAKKCYRNKSTILKGSWSGKITDHYFKLRKGNYFQYYERLAGLTKMREFNGSYSQQGDTLFLNFCGGVTPEGLSNTAILNKEGNEIVLLVDDPRLNQHFRIYN